MKCPICKGVGVVADPLRCGYNLAHRAAAVLVANGFSYRETMRLCGFKSTRSVVMAVRKYEKGLP